MFIHASLVAQTRLIKGKITDEKGGPIPNATVSVKGSSVGTATKMDGTFSLTAPTDTKTIVVSAVDMDALEIDVTNRSEVNVTLVAKNRTMQEVVFVGYGAQKKSEITSSMTKIGGDKVANVPFSSIDQILQGKAAGLQSITFSGQPGANQAIRIRGIGSANASAQPLFVIDGVQINAGDFSRLSTTTNVLAGVNPDDIESISVLKDAAAAAIYGARGANGVILINTKKGKAGKTQINFSAEGGVNRVGDIPDAATPVNSAQWFKLFKEGYKNTYLLNPANNPANADAAADAAAAVYGDPSTDISWLDQVTRSGMQQQYNLSQRRVPNHVLCFSGYFKGKPPLLEPSKISASFNLDHIANVNCRWFEFNQVT
jgi:TonB-dependent SusC/RagA subfamily outer membrane receptor